MFLRCTLPFLILAMPAALSAQESAVASLKDLVSAEVRASGFTLPQAAKVHIYAKGAGSRPDRMHDDDAPMFAHGWILNAATREVVWQMTPANSRREGFYRVADLYLDLPAGSYEAYFSNHGFSRDTPLAGFQRNVDRRELKTVEDRDASQPRGFLSLFGLDKASHLRVWKNRAGNYGMEVYVASGFASQVQTFQAPLRWRNELAETGQLGDGARWQQTFEVKKPVKLHLYAIGEVSGRNLHDHGWIQDLRTRKRVWEMSEPKAQFAGGGSKNRRQVETIQLPPGRYQATFVTDSSHSPADWNAAPPCDPLRYGLTLAVPEDADKAAVALVESKPVGPVLAELLRVGVDQDLRAPFSLKAPQALHIYALGEGTREGMADYAWIEDANGKTVWTMTMDDTVHGGGSRKNRLADLSVTLPKGTYTLRYRSDDSHAYGHWNSQAPSDPEHYGVTVRSIVE